MEVTHASVVHLVHHIQNGVATQDLVTDVCHQHDRVFILGDGCHKPRPHLQSANSKHHVEQRTTWKDDYTSSLY